jgi:hypothetical protein
MYAGAPDRPEPLMPFDFSIVGKPTQPKDFTYTWKDTVLYALGIGARKDELDYLYEGHGPKVYPSFAVVPMFPAMVEVLAKCGGDMSMVVHGGEKVQVNKAFPSSATLKTTGVIRGIY